MEQKHSTPHIISLFLIFAFSLGALFSVGTLIGKTNQAIALTPPPVIANPAGLYSLTMGLGGGRCVFITFSGTYPNGSPVSSASYTGTWNGSGDCSRAIAKQPDGSKDLSLTVTGEGLLAESEDATGYFSNNYSIMTLQAKLVTEDALKPEDVTGEYTSETFTGIKAFQKKNKIEATGYLDPKTLDLLNRIVIPTATYNPKGGHLYEVKPGIIKQTTLVLPPETSSQNTPPTAQPVSTPKTVPASSPKIPTQTR